MEIFFMFGIPTIKHLKLLGIIRKVEISQLVFQENKKHVKGIFENLNIKENGPH
jgi:hypothetical protein